MRERAVNLCNSREMKPTFKALADEINSLANGKSFAISAGGVTWFFGDSKEESTASDTTKMLEGLK